MTRHTRLYDEALLNILLHFACSKHDQLCFVDFYMIKRDRLVRFHSIT